MLQACLFLIPALFGGIFVALIETNTINFEVGVIVGALSVALVYGVLHTVSYKQGSGVSNIL